MVLFVSPVKESVRDVKRVGRVAFNPWKLLKVVEVVNYSWDWEMGEIFYFAAVADQPHLFS